MDWNKLSTPDPKVLGYEHLGRNEADEWAAATVERLHSLPVVFSPDWSAITGPEPWAVVGAPRRHLAVLGHCPGFGALVVGGRRGLLPTDSLTVCGVGRVGVARLTIFPSRGVVVVWYTKQEGGQL